MKVRISNIQRFCLHDGPGIRTTVFIKGCNLRCPWCSNPENIDFEKTKFKNQETGEEGYFGYDIEPLDLYNEIIKDKSYYKLNDGGVTFSGGEPLLQISALEPLLRKLKEKNINICIETALQVPTELVELASKYVDEFIVDIKILDKEKCKTILNGNIDLYLKNLEFLESKGGIYIFRIPLVNEYTLEDLNMEKILEVIRKFKPKRVEIFKVHYLAESKYKSIGKEIQIFSEIQDSKVDEFFYKIKSTGQDVKIIKI